MLQKDLLFPWRTALANVMLGLEIKGAARDEAAQRAHVLLDQLGLHGFADALSGDAVGRHAPARGAGAHAGQRPARAAARRAVRGARLPDQAPDRERHGPAGAQPAPLDAADHPRHRGGGLAVRPGDRAQPSADPHPLGLRGRARRRPHRHDGGARQPELHATMSAASGATSRWAAHEHAAASRDGTAGARPPAPASSWPGSGRAATCCCASS